MIGKAHCCRKIKVTYYVIMKLIENFIGKGHITFLDNFYNSVTLAQDLFEKRKYNYVWCTKS